MLNGRTTFADPWLRVRSDQVRTAERDVFGPVHVIEYPDWVTVVALTERDSLLLVREHRHGVGAVAIGLSSKLVNAGDGALGAETAEFAAERELIEETGHGGGSLERLITVHSNSSNQTNTAYCFLATATSRIAAPVHSPSETQETLEADLVDVWGCCGRVR